MAATALLFRDDPYAQTCDATVVGVVPDSGIVLDQTVFYAQGGGQPGDVGVLLGDSGIEIPIGNTVYAADRVAIVHVPTGPFEGLRPGDRVTARLDWGRRHRLLSLSSR